jgi:hypothetical protein
MRARTWDWLIGAFALVAGSIGVFSPVSIDTPDAVTPEDSRGGWVAPTPEEVAEATPFVLQSTGEEQTRTVVKLWDCAKAINGGKTFPCFLQESTDCVANGAVNSVNYLQAVQLARGPPSAGVFEFRPASRAWFYGVSRCDPQIGNKRLGRGGGSVGAWAAKAATMYGVLSQEDAPEYSGRQVDEWGARGVPDEYYWKAALFKVQTTALVRNWDQLADSLLNWYPVTCAGNVGFQMKPRVVDGKAWGVPSGSWAHQMCWLAIDTEAVSPFDGRKGAVWTQNSWGPNAHGAPVGDTPPGGFWIDRTTAERYLAQNDCWAFSNFDGFPARDLDFQIFRDGPEQGETLDVEFVASDTAKPASEHFANVDADTACPCGSAACLGSVLWLAHRVRRRARRAALQRALERQSHLSA